MELTNVLFKGQPVVDEATLQRLPDDYRKLLKQINGFIQFHGGLHIRGVCVEPAWHSLTTVWSGELALSKSYPAVQNIDVPFGQDAVGDQFILRDGLVFRLWSETGEIESLECGLFEFLEAAQSNPVEYLQLQPLVRFLDEGGKLEPGELINVYPPFCTKEAKKGVDLRAVPVEERLQFLAEFSREISGVEDGQQINIEVET